MNFLLRDIILTQHTMFFISVRNRYSILLCISCSFIEAPARIASFGQVLRKAVGKRLVLECLAVGNPTPRARWLTRDRPVTFSPFYEVTNEGNLRIHRKW